MPDIITDVSALHNRSTSIDVKNQDSIEQIVKALIQSMPLDASGLAAPQINFFKRIFLVNFPNKGMYVFVNPVVEKCGNIVTSTEGCLSLPGIKKTVWRHSKVTIKADIVYKVTGKYTDDIMFDDLVSESVKEWMLYDVDAVIAQHEFDHLEGILLIDIPEKDNQTYLHRAARRHQRIKRKRQLKVNKPLKSGAVSNPKKIAKMKKMHKKFDKHRRKQIEIEELNQAISEGIIKSD